MYLHVFEVFYKMCFVHYNFRFIYLQNKGFCFELSTVTFYKVMRNFVTPITDKTIFDFRQPTDQNQFCKPNDLQQSLFIILYYFYLKTRFYSHLIFFCCDFALQHCIECTGNTVFLFFSCKIKCQCFLWYIIT